ncbi:MAG: hypothetical protein LBN27_04510, partial [Prevotellaceae bacterium]|nr:hypothetical protein [Prevotellaceae bacterium]
MKRFAEIWIYMPKMVGKKYNNNHNISTLKKFIEKHFNKLFIYGKNSKKGQKIPLLGLWQFEYHKMG